MSGTGAEIGVGIIGFGLAGRVFHAPFVSAVPGLHLHTIVQRTGTQAQTAYPAVRIARTCEEMLADPAIALVIVATPNETHFSLAQQALEAGKHVVIDKPFATSSAEARALIALAEDRGRVLAPFHNRRWDGDFLTVEKLLAEKKLGRLVTFESHFDRFRPIPRENTWKEASSPANGLLFDLGPHLVDQCFALFGSPSYVTGSVRTDRDGSAIEDAFDIVLDYALPATEPRDPAQTNARSLRAWCRSTMIAAEPAPRFLLHGTGGSFRKTGVDPQEPALVAGAKVPPIGSPEAWLAEPEAQWGSLTLAPVPAEPANLVRSRVPTEPGDYRGFYANVRDAILGADTLAVTPSAGLDVIRVLEVARQSSRERRSLEFAPTPTAR